jgi:EmrB/QacA subfamily drug resistance transporter
VALSKPGTLITLIGIMLALFLGALDQTIVATALPRIVADLQGLDRYAWVATSYLLASTVLVPVYGKLADIMSRKVLEIWAVSIFLIGSMLCGLAGEFGTLPLLGDGMNQLIIFRAIQGLGAAGLMGLAFIIVADLFPPSERGKYQGLLGGVFALASVLGPLVGGFLTDHGSSIIPGIAGWRWVFYVNVPIGAVALWFLITRMPPLIPRGANENQGLDLLSAALLVLTLVPLVLVLQLDRASFPWLGNTSLLLLGLTAVSLILFIIRSLRVPNPVLDLQLFRNKVFSFGVGATFLLGAAFLATLIFLPLFLVNVVGISATQAGATLIPLSLGITFGSVIAGQLVSRYGRYRLLMLIGIAVLFVGVFLLSQMSPATTQLQVIIYMIICGIGLGPTMPLYTLAIQNAVDIRKLGQATSTSQFSRQIGGTIGTAVMGAVFTATLAVSMGALFPADQPGVAGFTGGEAQLEAAEGPDAGEQIVMAFEGLYARAAAAIRSGDEAQLQQVLAETPLPSEAIAGIMRGAAAAAPGPAREAFLSQLQAGFEEQGQELAQTVTAGLKQAFSEAVTRTWFFTLFIIIAAFVITVFIPVLPLRTSNEVDLGSAA